MGRKRGKDREGGKNERQGERRWEEREARIERMGRKRGKDREGGKKERQG